MSLETILIWVLIGAVAGWLASQIVRGGGFGLGGNIVLGIVGAFVGGWLFAKLGIVIFSGILGTIVAATVGAVVLLLLIGLFRRA